MINLPALVRARNARRRDITLCSINPSVGAATDLAAIIAPAWRIWAESVDAIMAGYDPVPLPTSDALTADSATQIQSAIDTTSADFLHRLVATITPALKRWAINVERIHRGKWVSVVKAGTGVDLSTILTGFEVQETVETFVARNVALARNVSDQAQAWIADAVFRGYQARTPVREVAKEVREASGFARDRSVRIAADQNAKLSAALDDQRRAEAGIDQYRWRHSHKAHPRAAHVARDGKVFPNSEPMGDTPGQAPFCGCRAQAYIPLMDEVG